MKRTLWIVDPKLGREAAAGVAESLNARGMSAAVRELPTGTAVVIDDAPSALEVPAGIVRQSTVEMPAETGVTRRALLDTFAGALVFASIAAGAGVVGMFASPPPARREDVGEIDVASLTDLKAKGSVRFHFGREPCILIHANGQLHALSLVCTHLGCLVEWSPKARQLTCPCHRAAFGLEGNVIEGPPPRPLTSYTVAVAGDRVLVRRRTDA
jgi:cytochrome b6-f complex iron-sulfur subunit